MGVDLNLTLYAEGFREFGIERHCLVVYRSLKSVYLLIVRNGKSPILLTSLCIVYFCLA
jgi:hypothetical protein